MNLDKIESALEPYIKRASKTEIKKNKEKVKKKEGKKKMGSKKSSNDNAFDDLADIVNIRKQKAVANELGEFIYEQEQRKKQRENKGENEQTQQQIKAPSIIDILLAEKPEMIKDMSLEDAQKLAMLSGNGGGSSDPFSMMMMMGLNQPKKDDMNNEMMKLIFNKLFDEKENKGGNDSWLMKFMMLQSYQQNQLMTSLLTNKGNEKKDTGSSEISTLIRELLRSKDDKKDLEKSMLYDKIKELEYRTQGSDPLGEAKRMIDYFKTFKSAFGGHENPEYLEHERKMKEMEWKQQKELKEEELRDNRMAQIGEMINRGVGTFADILSEPVGNAIKGKLEGLGKEGFKPEDLSEEALQNEIDLGDLGIDDIPAQQAPTYGNTPQKQPKPTKKKNRRFVVRESGDQLD